MVGGHFFQNKFIFESNQNEPVNFLWVKWLVFFVDLVVVVVVLVVVAADVDSDVGCFHDIGGGGGNGVWGVCLQEN